MNELLTTYTSLPNVHPAVVHFPVALWTTAILFEIACWSLRGRKWLDHAAAVLFALGAAGAGAAYFAGKQAAFLVKEVSLPAITVMAKHADWALYTVLVFLLVAIARLALAWADHRAEKLQHLALRVVVLAAALIGQGALVRTADLGGALVFRHGVAVRSDSSEAVPAGKPIAEPAPETPRLDAPQARLEFAEDGGLHWQPLARDGAALATLMTSLGLGGRVSPVAPDDSRSQEQGLRLSVTGPEILVFPGAFGNAQIQARVALLGFKGKVGVVHHGSSRTDAGVFSLSSQGKAELFRLNGERTESLGKGALDVPEGAFTLTVTAAGRHLKGLINETMVAHGHATFDQPGPAGLYLDGQGTVELRSFTVTPLE